MFRKWQINYLIDMNMWAKRTPQFIFINRTHKFCLTSLPFLFFGISQQWSYMIYQHTKRKFILHQFTNCSTIWMPETIVMAFILLFGLMIGNAYGGGLASIMTIPQ